MTTTKKPADYTEFAAREFKIREHAEAFLAAVENDDEAQMLAEAETLATFGVSCDETPIGWVISR